MTDKKIVYTMIHNDLNSTDIVDGLNSAVHLMSGQPQVLFKDVAELMEIEKRDNERFGPKPSRYYRVTIEEIGGTQVS